MIKHIPNTITIFNLLSGTVACLFALNGQYNHAFVMIILAAMFDFFDGMSARLLKAYSPIGKELDSLADVISFGLAPTFIIYNFVSTAYTPQIIAAKVAGDNTYIYSIFITLSFFLIACSALRLAKFNVDENQKENFIGLATPSAALLLSSFAVTINTHENLFDYFSSNAWIISIITVIIALLLVSSIPMFSFKIKSLNWNENKLKFSFVIFSLLIGIVLFIIGLFSFALWIFTIIISYIIINIFIWLVKK